MDNAIYVRELYFPSAKGDGPDDHIDKHQKHSHNSMFPKDDTTPSLEERKHFIKYDEKLAVKGGDICDLNSLLFTTERDYLVRSCTGDKAYAKDLDGKSVLLLAFYIPVFRDDCIASQCQDIIRIYRDLSINKHYDDFEFVLAILMRPGYENNEDAFNHFMSAFTCLAVPFYDYKSRMSLCQYVGLSGYYGSPRIYVVDKDHRKVWNVDLRSYGSDCYPFTYEKLKSLPFPINNMMHQKEYVTLESLLGESATDGHLTLTKAEDDSLVSISLSSLRRAYVGLYLCCDGKYMEKLHQAHQKCSLKNGSFDIVLIYQPFSSSETFESYKRDIDFQLRSLKGSKFWVLPFNDKVSRQLWGFCHKFCQDRLIMLGLYDTVVERNAIEIMDAFGPESFPFSRAKVTEMKCKEYRSLLTLQYFMPPGTLIDAKGKSVALSEVVRNKPYILLYLSFEDSYRDRRFTRLRSWCRSLRGADKEKFEVIVHCLDKDNAATIKSLTSEMKWLVAPYNEHDAHVVAERIRNLASYCEVKPYLCAFRNGEVRSLSAERYLKLSEPAAVFTTKRDLMEEDVYIMWKSRYDFMEGNLTY